MEKINNRNGIEMYYELDGTDAKIIILDSNGKYFNDLYYDSYRNDNGEEDIGAILHTLEETTIEEMCYFFGSTIYTSIATLCENEELTQKEAKDNDYLNIFNVNGKKHYAWSW